MYKKKTPCTFILIGINILIFLILSFFGMTEDAGYMASHGAMYVPYVIGNQEYYRLFTCMFLHFGIAHLINNMIVLLGIGGNLEPEIGTVKYIIIYLLSGLGGNVLSLIYDLRTMDYAVSAGASGAIFGLIGALFYVSIRNNGHLRNVSGRGILFMIVCSLYLGFTSGGVDNMAHIGGLATGFLLTVILYRKPVTRYRNW